MKAMEAAAAAYRPPLSGAGVHAASCSTSAVPQSERASLRASIMGDSGSRRNHGPGSLSYRGSRRARYTVRAELADTPGATVVSPFKEEEGEKKQGGLYSPDVYDELTVENVDSVLDAVRPYLISDGGDVEVASVDDGVVSLRLQGACGSCPSSTTTMKMGIERVLNEKFGTSLKGVVQVDQQKTGATVTGVDSQLEMLRPAIHNYGGSVQVASVCTDKGLVVIKYKGPAAIGTGIQAAIKDAFPDITEVRLVDEHHEG